MSTGWSFGPFVHARKTLVASRICCYTPVPFLGGSWRIMAASHQHANSTAKLPSPAQAVLAIVLALTTIAIESAQSQTFSVLHDFTGRPDGATSYATLIRGADGTLYGTTNGGGASNRGTVFKVDLAGKTTVLYSFTGAGDGGSPWAGLVRDPAGNLYGTTYDGGEYGAGTVFKLDNTGTETVLYSFGGTKEGGAFPFAGLLLDKEGNFYGTTQLGGRLGLGTVFELQPSGEETVLHQFTGTPDGSYPYGALIRDHSGNLYGTTLNGGRYKQCSSGSGFGCGTVFKLDKRGKETILHSFGGTVKDGALPYAGLVMDASKALYGTTNGGGVLTDGTVFKLDMTGKEKVLYSFSTATGSHPFAGLVRDSGGNLYGTAFFGGAHNGTVFKVSKGGEVTVLHTFGKKKDGENPFGGLVRDPAGNLYGSTTNGGSGCCGTIFRLVP
jgi:uncharacterized repeat protein (TIGR03803 family)